MVRALAVEYAFKTIPLMIATAITTDNIIIAFLLSIFNHLHLLTKCLVHFTHAKVAKLLKDFSELTPILYLINLYSYSFSFTKIFCKTSNHLKHKIMVWYGWGGLK
jgi:hypothetical protein